MLIETKLGPLPEEMLRKETGSNENSEWVCYYLHDELVRKDLHIKLNKPIAY